MIFAIRDKPHSMLIGQAVHELLMKMYKLLFLLVTQDFAYSNFTAIFEFLRQFGPGRIYYFFKKVLIILR